MELYQAYTDYEGMMELTESMFRYLAEKVCGSTKISYNGVEIDLGKPFARMTMIDAIKKYAGVDFDQVPDDAAAKKLADEHHIEYEERHKKGDIVNLFFEELLRERAYPANIYHGSPNRDITSHQEETKRPYKGRAFRAVL